jgi:hypothetical protein
MVWYRPIAEHVVGGRPRRRLPPVPRMRSHLWAPTHIETITVGMGADGINGQAMAVKLGAFVVGSCRRASTSSPERRTDLHALNMRW